MCMQELCPDVTIDRRLTGVASLQLYAVNSQSKLIMVNGGGRFLIVLALL